MSKYMIGVWYPEGGTPPPPDELEVIMNGVQAVHDDMAKAGVWVFGGALHGPDASTVVRANGADVLVTDGPYVETKEHLGGFTVITAPDLDAALDWGRKLADVTGLPIEVWPLRDGAR